MAETKLGVPPPAPRMPARKALFLVALGMGAACLGIAFGAKALLDAKDTAGLGRTAATLAGGGVIVASMGAPALKRQSLAREQLAAFAARRGLVPSGPDEVVGPFGSATLAVRIAYGSGPYKSRGASAILVHVKPADADPIIMTDSEAFDVADEVARHLDRLTDRALRKVGIDPAAIEEASADDVA
jgi:hypothetical protein